MDATAKDEIGDLSRSLAAVVVNTREQADAIERIAAGDLSVEVSPRSDRDVMALSMADVVAGIARAHR